MRKKRVIYKKRHNKIKVRKENNSDQIGTKQDTKGNEFLYNGGYADVKLRRD